MSRRMPLDREGYPNITDLTPHGDRWHASHGEAHRFMRAWFLVRGLEHPDIPNRLDERHLQIHDLIAETLWGADERVPPIPPMGRARHGFDIGHLARHRWEIEAARLLDIVRPVQRLHWRVELLLEQERYERRRTQPFQLFEGFRPLELRHTRSSLLCGEEQQHHRDTEKS